MSETPTIDGMTFEEYVQKRQGAASVQEAPVAPVDAVTKDIDNIFAQQFQSDAESEKEEPVEEVAEKKFQIRPLNARDIFPMTRIIRKIGLKDFAKCFEPDEINGIVNAFSTEENIDDIAEVVGVSVLLKIADVILEHIPDAGEEVFVFIAGLVGTTADEVASLPLDVFFDLVVDVFQRKEFVGFMRVVSRFVK